MLPFLAGREKQLTYCQCPLFFWNLEVLLSLRVPPMPRISMGEQLMTGRIELYSSIFSIDAVDEDLIAPDTTSPGVRVSNLEQLQDAVIKMSIQRGTPIKRGTRHSLTCRDVERVSAFSAHSRR